MDISVEELLEQEERKSNERAAAKARETKARENGSFHNNSDFVHLAPEPAEVGSDEANAVIEAHRHRLGLDGHRRGRDDGRSDTNRYSTEREENDERRSRRSRDLPDDDDDTRDGSDKGSANGSVRSRRRSRSPRSGTQKRGSYRERDRGGDYYSGRGSRPHDRYEDDRYRPGSSGDQPRRYDRRDPHRDDRDRLRSEGGGRRRYSGPTKNRTPEPTDDEKDRRTVFCQQLAARLRGRMLKEFFDERAGPVVEAQIVKDRVSQRSKGIGYVEFKDEDSVAKAIALTGQKLLGIPIIVQVTEAEKNRQTRTTEGGATQTNGIPFHRLYVGNIHFSATEDHVRQLFEPFGELEFVQLQKEETGRSKGYGFVQYVEPEPAKKALAEMNNFMFADRPIRVGLGNDKFTPESTQSLLSRFGAHGQQQGSSFSGMGGRGAHAGGSANFDRASGKDQDKTGGASALDDTDVGGVNYSNYSRHSLMSKLARTDMPEPKVAPKVQPKKAPVDQPAPTRCIMIKYMFDQEREAALNPTGWQKALEDDVRTECEKQYGIVVHIAIALDSDDGEVYVKFDRVQGGENAIRGLNGRHFNGSQLSAQYVVDQVYNMMWPAAAKH